MKDEFFKAISDQNRRRILALLREHNSLSAGEISEYFDISKPSLSEHLRILRNADLIIATKKQQFIYYRINTSVMEDIFEWLTQFFKPKGGIE